MTRPICHVACPYLVRHPRFSRLYALDLQFFRQAEPPVPKALAAMDYDVELMRELLFELEVRQTSPRSTVVISVDEEAMALGRPTMAVENGLSDLLDLDYIDGPESDIPGFFLFRKLTRKGAQFVRTMRDPRDWERLKRHFSERRLEDNI